MTFTISYEKDGDAIYEELQEPESCSYDEDEYREDPMNQLISKHSY